ncbi:hypothetical protein ACFL6S_22900, partial [Candidatus Poribacteria bacterium]
REVTIMASHEFSVPVLCDVTGVARSSFYYKSQASDDSELRSDIDDDGSHPKYSNLLLVLSLSK